MEKESLIHWSELEPLCIIRLIINKLWLVIMTAVTCIMAASIVLTALVSDTYSSRVTFAVASRSGTQAYYQNINTAAEVAAIYSQLLESSVMHQTVSEALGGFEPGTIKAAQLGSTNLITVTATADSPRKALMTVQSLIDNYAKLSDYVSSTAVLTVINTPTVYRVSGAAGDPMRVYMLSGIGGALFMVLVLFAVSAASGTIQNSTGARNRLDSKVMTTIPHEAGRKGSKKSGRAQMNILSPLVSFGFTEAMHRIAARFEQEMSAGRRVFLFSSVYEAEGKSTVAANTALALATTGVKTLFIDLDLRRPVQNEVLSVKVSEKKEFGELLVKKSNADTVMSAIITEPRSGLDALLSTKCYTDRIDSLPVELLGQVIERARGIYECIIIDTPPISYFADSEAFAEIADATVLVVRQDVAPAAEINTAIDSLRACRAEFIGCILNDMRTMSGHGASGSQYYGHYGKYGKYGKYTGYDTVKKSTETQDKTDMRGNE